MRRPRSIVQPYQEPATTERTCRSATCLTNQPWSAHKTRAAFRFAKFNTPMVLSAEEFGVVRTLQSKVLGCSCWMIHTHQQHVTDKASNDVAASVLLLIKDSMLSMDMSTLMERMASHLPPDQREPGIEASKGFAAVSSLSSKIMSDLYASSTRGSNYSFNRMAKEWRVFHDAALVDVCESRVSARRITAPLESFRSRVDFPIDLAQAIDAVRGDELLLEPECSSNRAIKLLQSQPKNTVTPNK